MRTSFTRCLGFLGSLLLLGSMAACTTNTATEPTHKAATSICLIKSTSTVPGSANRELAQSAVQAQVVFGVRAREVVIKDNESVSLRLLRALQAGCVLMVSGERKYLDELVTFAKGHTKMLVVFVGGQLALVDQPSNFRWFKDDPAAGAKLAGFRAGELGETVSLIVQNGYFQAKAITEAFREGVQEYERVSGQTVTLNVSSIGSVAEFRTNLEVQPQPEVVALFAGPTIWKSVADYPEITFLGADLQFGQTVTELPDNVVASLERGTTIHILRAVSALLDSDVNSTPPIRSEKTLGDALFEVRSLTDPSDNFTAYLQSLIELE